MDDAAVEAVRAVAGALEDAHELLHECAESYHDPERFERRFGRFVQAARNVTFRAQAVKAAVAGFDRWYPKWREVMAADPTMKWMSDARTEVTKRRGLSPTSRARARVIWSYLSPGEIAEQEVDPRLHNHAIAAAVASKLPPEVRKRALVEVTREWHFDDLPDREVLNAGRQVIRFLNALVADLVRLAQGEQTAIPAIAVLREPVPECMTNFDDATNLRVNAATGETYTAKQRALLITDEMGREAATKYGGLDDLPVVDKGDLETVGEWYVAMSKKMLAVDGSHGLFVFLRRADGSWDARGLLPTDRLEKFVLWQRVADDVRQEGFDAFVMVGETWTAPLDAVLRKGHPEELSGVRGREEALLVHVESADGFRRMWSTKFGRGRRGRIKLDPTVVTTPPNGGFAHPIRRAWFDIGIGPEPSLDDDLPAQP